MIKAESKLRHIGDKTYLLLAPKNIDIGAEGQPRNRRSFRNNRCWRHYSCYCSRTSRSCEPVRKTSSRCRRREGPKRCISFLFFSSSSFGTIHKWRLRRRSCQPLFFILSIDAPTSTKGRPKPAFLVKNRLRTGAGSLVFLGGRSVKDPLLLPFINRSRSLRAFISTTSSTGKGQLCIA